MTNNIKIIYHKDTVNIIFFAMITTIIYALFIMNLNSSFVRDIDDKAFDIMSQFISIDKDINESIIIFKVDNDFLKNEELMDDTNRTNRDYGEFIPRRYFTSFIERLDHRNPKLLFIDYELDAPRISINKLPLDIDKLKKLLDEEEKFIEILNKQHNYPIYLVHHKNYNYLEENVNNPNVIFISTTHVQHSSILRRYESYIVRKNDKGDFQRYYYAPFKFLDINLSSIKKPYDVIKNRFIYFPKDDTFKNINSYSMNKNLLSLPTSDINNNFIFIGEAHSNSQDKHKLSNGDERFGIEILANNVISTIYLNPQLKLFPLLPSIIIIFFIALFARIFSLKISNKIANFIKKFISLNHQIIILISIFVFMFFLFIINFFISWLFLVYGKIWFSYAVSYILFEILTWII